MDRRTHAHISLMGNIRKKELNRKKKYQEKKLLCYLTISLFFHTHRSGSEIYHWSCQRFFFSNKQTNKRTQNTLANNEAIDCRKRKTQKKQKRLGSHDAICDNCHSTVPLNQIWENFHAEISRNYPRTKKEQRLQRRNGQKNQQMFETTEKMKTQNGWRRRQKKKDKRRILFLFSTVVFAVFLREVTSIAS
mmetsp:Transcript_28207/g.44728  ORF Transcript_28207/g.44728 Transcript_28207/m.44728 type:complete len:191 (-) Transcript_28207:1777-2349(-)